MSEPIVTIYELELELTDSTAEPVLYKHTCKQYQKAYKSRERRLFRFDLKHHVTKAKITPNHIVLRVWTTVEEHIPELLESLHMAATVEIASMQRRLIEMYDQVQTIHGDTPVRERGIGWRK